MKAYSGAHTQGCHICGGFPGSLQSPVAKLFQCLKCGFFTCNKHLKGGITRACPNCGASGRDLKTVMTQQSQSHVKSGGMPGHVAAKKQKHNNQMQESLAHESAGASSIGGGSGGVTQSNNTKGTTVTVEKQNTVDNQRVAEALSETVTKHKTTLEERIESLHSPVTLSKEEITSYREESKKEATEKNASNEEIVENDIDLSEVSLDDLLLQATSDLKENSQITKDEVSTPNKEQLMGQDESHEDTVDFEALEEIDRILKEQEQGLSLTRKIITDAYFRIESLDSLNACEDYLKKAKDRIFILSADAAADAEIKQMESLMADVDAVFAATAFSPKSIKNGKIPNIEPLKKLLNKKKKFIAVGEVSLDLHYAPFTIEQQKELFLAQAKLAVEKDMPLLISSKKADKEVYKLMNQLRKENVKVQGIVVPVVRTVEMFQMVLDHGFHLLLRPEVTHDNEDLYRECLKELPIEKLLLASGVEVSPPKKYFGRWNSPEYIDETISYASEMFSMEKADFIRQMAINFNKIFNSDPEAGDDEFDFMPTLDKPTLTITEEKLLENDVDDDGDTLFIKEIEDDMLVGDIYFDRQNRLFIYTPKKGFIGADKFKYIVTDGRGGFDSATVTINVSKDDSANNEDEIIF